MAPPGRRATGRTPQAAAQIPVLTLGIDHPGPPAEHSLAPQERLDEGALASAYLPEDHHVGIGDHALGVELEGIEDERPAQEVIPDDHAPLAQAGLGDERVGRAQIAGGDLVSRDPRSSRAEHVLERSRQQ
jgi:hypothetical protein